MPLRLARVQVPALALGIVLMTHPVGSASRIAPASATIAAPPRGVVLISDFEGAAPLSGWTFSNGPEYPGASGSLEAAPGYRGGGAKLQYAISCTDPSNYGTCGHYVSASTDLGTGYAYSSMATLGLWMQAPPDVRLKLRLRDAGGQVFQYGSAKPLEAALGGWFYHRFTLDTPEAHWSGANDGVFHGSIVWLALLVADPYIFPTSGAVLFDELSLRYTEPAITLDPGALPARPALQSAGQLGPRLGVQMHYLADNQVLDAIRDAGFTTVRADLLWDRIERSGSFDFGRYDAFVSAAAARGLGVLFTLDYGHPDHTPNPSAGFPWPPSRTQDVQAFSYFARLAAARYASANVRFEVWNEPNVAWFWGGTPSAAAYAGLASSALSAIKVQNPSATAATAGISNPDIGYLRTMIRSGGATNASAVGLHFYRRSAPETAVDDVLAVRRLFEVEGIRGRPIWDTEWGYSSSWSYPSGTRSGYDAAARARQAVYAVRSMLTMWVLNLPLAVWYDVKDDQADPNNPEMNFGLLDYTGAEKPAMRAMRQLSSATAHRTLEDLAVQESGGLHVARLAGADDTVLTVWLEPMGRSQEIRYPLRGSVEVRAMDGAALAAESCSVELGGSEPVCTLTITEGAGPVYLRFSGTGAPAQGGVSQVYLSDLPVIAEAACMRNDWGPFERDRSNGESAAGDGGPITLNGVVYAKGLGVHASSSLCFDLAIVPSCHTLVADTGVDDEVAASGSVRFGVSLDGKGRYLSGVMTGSSPTAQVRVGLWGGRRLTLSVDNGGDSIAADHADWANARLLCSRAEPLATHTYVLLNTRRGGTLGW